MKNGKQVMFISTWRTNYKTMRVNFGIYRIKVALSKIAIDDYGTGYSSLSYLKRLPISILKIDKSFIEDIGEDPNDTIIVKSTIQLAHNLGFKVVAEGVETKEQLDFLKLYECDYAQGYYLSKPLSIDKLQAYRCLSTELSLKFLSR